MKFREHFRTKQEWLDSTNGCIELNTSSDVAAKNYDATLTQLCGWYEDPTLGGLDETTRLMVEADPDFILGRALELELCLMGALNSPRFDSELSQQLDALNRMIERKDRPVSEQELLHVQVVNRWAKSELKEATKALEKLSTLYPEDVSALKMNQDTYFMLGSALPMRHSLAGSLPRMCVKNPLKGYAHGMFAFALEESNMYQRAQEEATRALSLIPFDTWAIHNYAHCLEMQGQIEEGLKWMYDKKSDWADCKSLACHQYWHTALFHINNNQFDEAVSLLETQILPRCVSSTSSLDLHDAASMIYRMQLINLFDKISVDHPSRNLPGSSLWKCVYDICKPHKRDHLLGFNDAHFMMIFLELDDLKAAQELIETIDETPSLIEGQTVVKPLLKAMYEFKKGNYATCVRLLEPIRFDIIKIGGSHAQRDVFEQLLIVAALKSDESEHNKLGQRMLIERDTLHGGHRLRQTDLLAEHGAQSVIRS